MDAQPGPRADRPATRRLRDISHLYISTSRRNVAARPGESTPQPAPRRCLRLVVVGPAGAAARAELAANLALALARLGRRVVVLDLDPALPNAGFRLGLEPRAYLAHLSSEGEAWLEAGFFGVRVLCGLAGRGPLATLQDSARDAVRDSDCVLAIPASTSDPSATLRDLGACVPWTAGETTMGRAGARSPMINAWLATARRAPAPVSPIGGPGADAALCVVDARQAGRESAIVPSTYGDVPLRIVAWGESAERRFDGEAWARVPAHGATRWPQAALDATQPLARLFEGLAQSLLAGAIRTGGPHA